MIEITYGNLLNFPKSINRIAHSCNTLNIMGAGIAKQIKDRFPYAWQADCIAHKNNKNHLGSYSFGWVDLDSQVCEQGIYNLYTQESIGGGREVNYEAFYSSLSSVRDVLEKECLHSGEEIILGLPYGISCGLAGGSWRIIFAMIEDIFIDSPIKIYIVEYDGR